MNILKQNILVTFLIALVLFSSSVIAEILFTHENDSIAYDESNNHYIITYAGLQGEINEVIWQPPTDINVEVTTKYKALKNGRIKYEYRIKVDKTSKLDLNSFQFYALAVDKDSIKVPNQWDLFVRDTYDSNDPEQLISWFTVSLPTHAGKEVKDFNIESMSLPVYGVVYTSGKTEGLAYVDYGPNVDTQTYFNQEILSKNFDGKGINTVVPLIPISIPFKSVETYTAFHQSLLDYIEKGFVDARIATSLTDTSKAVLTALTKNDVKDALSNLKAVKKLIEGEDENHKNHDKNDAGKPQLLIVKELRKILKFNLKFIEKKLKGESADD